MHDDWKKLMSDYQNTDGILVANANCDESGEALCNKLDDTQTFPYIIFGSPSKFEKYEGARDYDSLLNFAKQHLGPMARQVEAASSPGAEFEEVSV